uniref:Chemokine interleukin-8-like domain-containing protein n=1 Tax=Strigamia maritima TaxID=126957 RepID=T1IPG2_STRMM
MKSIFFLILQGCLIISTCYARIDSIDRSDSLNQEGNCCKCAHVTPVGNFSLKQFSSTWYMIDKSNPRIRANEKCNRPTISAINATYANITGSHQDV